MDIHILIVTRQQKRREFKETVSASELKNALRYRVVKSRGMNHVTFLSVMSQPHVWCYMKYPTLCD